MLNYLRDAVVNGVISVADWLLWALGGETYGDLLRSRDRLDVEVVWLEELLGKAESDLAAAEAHLGAIEVGSHFIRPDVE